MFRRPPSLHRVPRVGSPASQVLLRRSDSLPPSRRAPLPSPGGTAVRSSFAPAGPSTCCGPGPLIFRSPDRILMRRGSGSPRFLWDPLADMPCSWTPVDRDVRPLRRRGFCLPSEPRTSAPPPHKISGLDHTACPLAVYASPGALLQQTQDSLPAGGHPWPCWIGYQPGPIERFPVPSPFPSPRLCLAHRLR